MTKSVVDVLKSGGIGVLPTDTIYGLVGSAQNPGTVERIYQAKKRHPDKPFIILIGSIEDLKLFGIEPDSKTLEVLNKYWPGQVSIVLPLTNKKDQDSRLPPDRMASVIRAGRGNDKEDEFSYLHRGTNSLAFRLPSAHNLLADNPLLQILKEAGPLIAPSANPEGQPPAKDIAEAKKYFGDSIDFYLDGQAENGQASTLIEIKEGKVNIIRVGAVTIN